MRRMHMVGLAFVCVGGWVGGGGGRVLTGVDMRKPMKRDRKRRSVRKNGREFKVHPHDVW